MRLNTTGNYIKLLIAIVMLTTFSCKNSRYREPKKPHNHYRKKGKNSWMEQKRQNMQQF
jgi:hypothetical protein